MVRSQLRAKPPDVTPTGTDFFSLSGEHPRSERPLARLSLRKLGFGPLALGWVPGHAPLGLPGSRSARRLPAALRQRSSLAIGRRQPRLANALLGPRPFPIPRHRAGNGRASPLPHSDGVSGGPSGLAACPDQFERREQPPAVVAPQNAARDQLPRHRRGVQTLAGEP